MNDAEYTALGKYIIEHLEKLMRGEHMGRAVVCPIKVKNGHGICRVQIDMPTKVEFGYKNGEREFFHYTWVPDSNAYVLDDYVFRERKKGGKSH